MIRWSAVKGRWRSITGIAWLIVAIAGLSLLSAVLALKEPDGGMAVRGLSCHERGEDGRIVGAERPVDLPYAAPFAQRMRRGTTVCTFTLGLTQADRSGTALLIPSFVDSIALTVNGQRLAIADVYMMRNLRFATLPAFIPLPEDILQAGENSFTVSLSSRPGRAVALDRIFFGTADELRPYYHARWFVTVALPTLVVGGEIALSVIFALIWSARPRESTFGWLAVTLALGALRGSVLIPDFQGANFLGEAAGPFYWDLVVPWETLAGLMFCRAIAGVPNTRWTGLLALPPLASLLAFAALPGNRLPIGAIMLMACVYFLLAIAVLVRGAQRGNRDARIVLPGMVVLLAFVVHDCTILLHADPEGVLLTRTTFSVFLIAIVTLVTLRFVRAMQAADNATVMLRERVAVTEAELRVTYEELRLRREAEAVERERLRLMRDLHDGLGGELVSMLALADGVNPNAREIASHARAALADMRLIIGSLEDYGGDLSLALGAWRERAEPQVRAAGLTLAWSAPDLPPIEGLGSAQVLDILRIVQEAVTNVIRHARASRVSVAVFEQDDSFAVAICDDGRGFDESAGAGGNGIGNMRMRAGRLNAGLTIRHGDGETRVLLTLPRAFPPNL